MLKHTMTMFIAEKTMNNLMRSADLRPDYKWYCILKTVVFETTTPITEAYFTGIMEKSKAEFEKNGWWVPAIKYQDNFFAETSVKIVSDGKVEMFVKGN